MKNLMNDVGLFHKIANQPIGDDLPTMHSWALDQYARNIAGDAGMLRNLAKAGDDPRLLRASLMMEEVSEIIDSLNAGDHEGVADGIADLVYVALGTAVAFGIPMGAVWAEVQRANLDKFPTCRMCEGRGRVLIDDYDVTWEKCTSCNGTGRVAIVDESGKVQKPRGWTQPNITAALERDGWVDPRESS